MPDTIYKGKLKQKTSTGSITLHPETEAGIVIYSNSTSGLTATNVQAAIDEIENRVDTAESDISSLDSRIDAIEGSEITDVQNGSGTSLVSNHIATVTPDGIGAVAANASIVGGTKAKITYDSKGLVTGGADLQASDIPSLTLSKISDAGEAASKGVSTAIPATGAVDTKLATEKAVKDAIDALPEPMVFKGTLGTGGTITDLPAASAANEGYTYKVITAGTYASIAAKVGDMFISNSSAWVLIPAGDEADDTWRAIKVNGTEALGSAVSTGAVDFKNGDNITVTAGSSGAITLGVASGYSIPSTSKQSTWDAKQDALAPQTAYSAKGSSTKVPQITTNSLGQVTLISEQDIAFPTVVIPDITIVAGTGSGNAVTSLEVDSTDKHKIKVNKATTFATSADIANFATKASVTPNIYSAVQVNSEGIVTAGGQVFQVVTSGSPSVVNGGLYFEVNA